MAKLLIYFKILFLLFPLKKQLPPATATSLLTPQTLAVFFPPLHSRNYIRF